MPICENCKNETTHVHTMESPTGTLDLCPACAYTMRSLIIYTVLLAGRAGGHPSTAIPGEVL